MAAPLRALPHRPIPLGNWPDTDRRLWEAAQASSHVTRLRPKTVCKIAEGYGLWLDVQLPLGNLKDVDCPSQRVSPERLRAYVDTLRQRGHTHKTIQRRLWDLRSGLRIMVPALNLRWISLPSRRMLGPPLYLHGCNQNGWPETDLYLWKQGTKPGDFFEGPTYAQKLRPPTLSKYANGYSAWLAFLRSRDLLDTSALPAERVSQENVQAYFQARREVGNTSATIITRHSDLRAALRIMQPEVDFRWLVAPGGCSLASVLPGHRRSIQVIDSDVLYQWGHALMQEALINSSPSRRQAGFRDGLLISIFAARGPRLRSIRRFGSART